MTELRTIVQSNQAKLMIQAVFVGRLLVLPDQCVNRAGGARIYSIANVGKTSAKRPRVGYSSCWTSAVAALGPMAWSGVVVSLLPAIKQSYAILINPEALTRATWLPSERDLAS